MIIIPDQTTKDFQQRNTSDTLGNIWVSKNMDYNDDGYIKLNERVTALIQNDSNFGAVTSIVSGTLSSGSFAYYIMTSGYPYSVTGDGTYTSLDGAGHTGSIYNDGVIWQGKWYISQTSSLASYNGTTWTTGIGSLGGASIFHPLCVNEGLNYIAIGENNTVLQYDSSFNSKTTLTIPSTYEVRRILYNNSNYYIFTKNKYGGDSVMFIWDGTTSTAQYGFTIPNCTWAFSAVIYKGTPTLISSNGQLLRFNGAGFEELAHLPVTRTSSIWYDGSGVSTGKVSARGMVVRGDFIYINLDGSISGFETYLQNQPSGVWIYDPNTGLYHAGAPTLVQSYTKNGTADSTTDIITFSDPVPSTGQRILFRADIYSGFGLSSIPKFYYAIKQTSTTLKLATTYDNAIAGTAVDLTASGTCGSFIWHLDNDFAQTLSSAPYPGAIALVAEGDTQVSSNKNMTASKVIFGFSCDDASFSSTIKGLYSFTLGENRGYFVTQKIFSNDIKDSWPKIFLKFNSVFTAYDKAIIKYRADDRLVGSQFTMSTSTGVLWIDSRCFSTAGDMSEVMVGDEIEIISGAGSGCLAHVYQISVADAGRYLVILDEDIPNITAGNYSSVIASNYHKLQNGTATYTNTDQFIETFASDKSKWIQFKVELRGISKPYFEELQIVNSADKKPE